MKGKEWFCNEGKFVEFIYILFGFVLLMDIVLVIVWLNGCRLLVYEDLLENI